jgi:hypothetical protein
MGFQSAAAKALFDTILEKEGQGERSADEGEESRKHVFPPLTRSL